VPTLHHLLLDPRVDGFELAAVDRNDRLAKQFKAPAQHHKLTSDLADSLAVVFAEIGYRLEVRHQAAGQPHQLDVALALPLQIAAMVVPFGSYSIFSTADCLDDEDAGDFDDAAFVAAALVAAVRLSRDAALGGAFYRARRFACGLCGF